MKVLLVGDLHIGIRGDSSVYHNIFGTWLDKELIPTISTEDPTHIFFFGDIFDNRNSINSNTMDIAIKKFDELVKKFSDKQFIIIVGNHDIYYKSSRKVTSLKTFINRHPNLTVINKITKMVIDSKEFIIAPWLISDEEVKEVFSKKADICLGHFEINGFQLVKGVVENRGLSAKKFRDTFSKTFSGHFHIRDEQDGISYIGTPYQMNWNDWGNEKGLTLLDLRTMQSKLIINKESPLYEKVFFSKLKNKTANLSNVAGNFVQLIIDDECNDKTLKKIQELINAKKPMTFTVDDLNAGDELSIENMDENLSSPFEYLTDYIGKVDLPKEYDRNKITKMVNEIYGSVIK